VVTGGPQATSVVQSSPTQTRQTVVDHLQCILRYFILDSSYTVFITNIIIERENTGYAKFSRGHMM